MLGCLIKDIKNILPILLYYVLIVAVFYAISAIVKNVYLFSGTLVFVAVMGPMQAFAYDEKDNWDKFALAAGVSRAELVFSRYILGLVFFAPIWLIGFTLLFFISADVLPVLLMFGGAGLLVLSVCLPLIFKRGVENARAAYMIVLLGVLAVCVGIGALCGTLFESLPDLLLFTACALVGVSVLSLVISVFLSLNIYKKKDF